MRLRTCASALDLIGQTPMVHLARLREESAGDVFAKLEMHNPGGSVKDRTALGMIEEGERSGALRRGGTIIEPTAGNTGIGLAVIGALKGYRVILVVPEKYSREKLALMRALGGEVVRTPAKEGMKGAITRAGELAASIDGAWIPHQFENPGNPGIHYRTTAPEIHEQMEGRLDALVVGAGTGGTLTGAARYLKERLPRMITVLVEPVGSVYGGGSYVEYKVEGIGSSFVPAVCEMGLVDRMMSVSEGDIQATVRALARKEGLLVGGSSGASVFAALAIARELGGGSRVVTVCPDGAERYLSKDLYGFDGGNGGGT